MFDDLVIEGLPQSRPFLVAKRISVSMLWTPLLHKEVVFDAIEMNARSADEIERPMLAHAPGLTIGQGQGLA